MKKLLVISLLLISISWVQDASAQSVAKRSGVTSELKVSPALEASINVFPNPAVDYIIVEINNEEEIVSPVFELFSLIGSSVRINAEEISENQYKIPVDHAKKGYYFIVVKDEVTRLKIAHKFLKN